MKVALGLLLAVNPAFRRFLGFARLEAKRNG